MTESAVSMLPVPHSMRKVRVFPIVYHGLKKEIKYVQKKYKEEWIVFHLHGFVGTSSGRFPLLQKIKKSSETC